MVLRLFHAKAVERAPVRAAKNVLAAFQSRPNVAFFRAAKAKEPLLAVLCGLLLPVDRSQPAVQTAESILLFSRIVFRDTESLCFFMQICSHCTSPYKTATRLRNEDRLTGFWRTTSTACRRRAS